MAIAVVASAKGTYGSPPSFDSTGANLIVAAVAYYYGGVEEDPPTDNKGNTGNYVGLTSYDSSNYRIRLFYCPNPTVGASHVITPVVGGYDGIDVAAFSGAAASSVYDSISGGTDTTPGPLTPSVDNCLLIAAICHAVSNFTIDDGFTELQDMAYNPGVSMGCGLAYKIQTTAASANPTLSASGTVATCLAAFRAAAVGNPKNVFGGIMFDGPFRRVVFP